MPDDHLLRSHERHLDYMRRSRFYSAVRKAVSDYFKERTMFGNQLANHIVSQSFRRVPAVHRTDGGGHVDLPLTGENVRLEYPPPVENAKLRDRVTRLQENTLRILELDRRFGQHNDVLSKLRAFLAVIPLELAARDCGVEVSDDLYRGISLNGRSFDPEYGLRIARLIRAQKPSADRVYLAVDRLSRHVSLSADPDELLEKFAKYLGD